MAKNARKLELGPANIYITTLPHAHAMIGDYPYGAGSGGIYLESVRPGAGLDASGNAVDYSGNAVSFVYTDSGAAVGQNPVVTVVGLAISVDIQTDVTTIDSVIKALGNTPESAFLVTAARGVGSVGTETVDVTDTGAYPTAVFLTGGDGVEETVDVGFLGDEVAYQVTTESANLTGAQTGNVPQDKVVIGGQVKVVIPFKEISLDNLRRGVPSARVVQNADQSKRRVDFTVAVGQSMRQTLSVKMTIKKIKGGFESPLPADHIIIPEISPAEGEVNFPFAPTTQRVIMTNWYAWPDPNTGRWAFMGDENP
jgi:hypothetical protein